MKKLTFAIALTLVSAACFAQETKPQCEIHETAETKTIKVHSLYQTQLGYCYNGVFTVFDEVYSKNYIFDKTGQLLGEVQSSDLLHFFDGEFAKNSIRKGNHFEAPIIRTDGSVATDTGAYQIQLSEVQNGSFLLDKDGKLFYVNLKKNVKRVVSTEWKDINATVFGPCCNGLHLYKDQLGKYGYISEDGAISIPAQFRDAQDFSDGLAAVKDDKTWLWGYINVNGKYVIPPTFSASKSSFHNGYAAVCKNNGTYVYINKSGEVVSPEYALAYDFYEGYAWVCDKDCSIVDTNFNAVITLSNNVNNVTRYNSDSYGKLLLVENFDDARKYEIYSTDGSLLLSSDNLHPLILAGELIQYRIYDGKIFQVIERGYINTKGEILVKITQSDF